MNILKQLVKWFEKKKKITFLFLILTFITMFCFSSIPGSSMKGISTWWLSVGYHITIFAVFSFFLLAFLINKRIGSKEILLTVLISIIFGILDEIHQIFVPFRSASLDDVMIDLTGTIISISFYTLIKKIGR